MKTAVALLLGERREALSSTTRNHSSPQPHKGASQNRGPPTPSRDEDPHRAREDPPQRAQAPPPTKSNAFHHQTHQTQPIPTGTGRTPPRCHPSPPTTVGTNNVTRTKSQKLAFQ